MCVPRDPDLSKRLEYRQMYSLLIFVLISLVPKISYAQQEVSIQVVGAVKPHCGFAQSAATSAAPNSEVIFAINPDQANWAGQSGKIALSLACNAPFTLAAQSSHGGLVNQSTDAKPIGGNFSNQIAYDLALTITTEDAATPLVLACASKDMIINSTNCGASSGDNAAIGYGAGIGEASISLSGASGFPIRGRYQDTIVLALAFQ
jgi:hypothetical protein